jgi:hypothetical protein
MKRSLVLLAALLIPACYVQAPSSPPPMVPAVASLDAGTRGARVAINTRVAQAADTSCAVDVDAVSSAVKTEIANRLRSAGFVVIDTPQGNDYRLELDVEVRTTAPDAFTVFLYTSSSKVAIYRGNERLDSLTISVPSYDGINVGDASNVARHAAYVGADVVNATFASKRFAQALGPAVNAPAIAAAAAGCTRDADCKGERVCDAGACVDPRGGARRPVPAPVAAAAPQEPTFVAGQPQPAAYALIVGIEHYRDVIPAVGAKRDAERFRDLAKRTLGIREENIRVAIDERATMGDIRKELDWLKSNVPANGRVYFFYSGHGAPDASQGTPYLLPYDGDAKFVDKTGMPLADVLKALGSSKAKEVLAVVDSCFSGAGGRSVLPEGARPLVRVKETAAVAHVTLFSAASGAEISGPAPDNDGGLFSKLVAQGLGTAAADIDGDSQVTLRELADWVAPRVAREAKRSGREQTPSLSEPSGSDAKSFAIAYGLAR